MPVHDWTRVEAGIFHAFHQLWIGSLCNRLNMDCLPHGYFALPEQIISGPEADMLALQTEPERYAKKADRIVVRHHYGKVIAVIEIVSPGNKGSRHAVRAFVDKATRLLEEGIHLLVVDLFPPSKRDPEGIHEAVWHEINDASFKLPVKKRLTLAAYSAGPVIAAYVEPISVGNAMPDMRLFLEPDKHVLTPLESTYQTTWDAFPEEMRTLLE